MSLTHLTDFSDRLSPMLVKELRQGLRARSFTMLFLVFQGLLAFILLFAGAASSSDYAGSFASGVIFTLFAGAALMIQPMRGINALSSEITGNTIEMMAITRLSAWRIVFGKWIAIVSQTALILITIIPYLILRYFFGGMILIGELVFLALIFVTSMSLTAITVGLSGNSTKIIRVLPILGFIALIRIVPGILFSGGFNNFMSYCAMSDWESRARIACYVAFIAYMGWCALSHGTSVIAPVAENHSTIRRLIALGMLLLAVGIGFHESVDPRILPLVFGIILAPAVITALTEPSNLLPPVCQPFLKLGLPGRVACLFLFPGWPAGVYFTALVFIISICGFLFAASGTVSPAYQTGIAIVSLAFTGGILLPALLAALFSRQESKRFTNFIAFVLALVILTIIPTIFASMNNHEKYLWFFIWNPLTLLAMVNDSDFQKDHLLTAAIAVNLLILTGLLVTAAIAFRRYRPIIEEAEAGMASTRTTAP